MITFIGDFVCKSDAKGRIVLPAVFKKVLNGEGQLGFVVRKDLFDECLVLIPHNEWMKEVELMEKRLSNFRQKDRRLKRAMYRSTAEVTLDGNGRFLVPKRLMEMIGVEKEVVLLGVGNQIELWSKERFEADELSEDELSDLAEGLLGGDINEEDDR